MCHFCIFYRTFWTLPKCVVISDSDNGDSSDKLRRQYRDIIMRNGIVLANIPN